MPPSPRVADVELWSVSTKWSPCLVCPHARFGKDARQGFLGGAEDAGVNPPLRPVRLEPLRLVDLLDLHGNTYDIRARFARRWGRHGPGGTGRGAGGRGAG